MVKNIIPKLGMSCSVTVLSMRRKCSPILPFSPLVSLLLMMAPVSFLSSVSGRAGYQPTPAADGAISLGDGLGGHVVPLQPRVPAGQKLLYKVAAGQ